MEAKQFIDLIMPEHGRTSCSDKDLCNGLYSRNGTTWHGRCTRCLYLEILENEKTPEGFDQDDCVG